MSLPVNQVALKEATQCNIPTIGIVDTDCDPRSVTFPIPGNDDSASAVSLCVGALPGGRRPAPSLLTRTARLQLHASLWHGHHRGQGADGRPPPVKPAAHRPLFLRPI